MNQSQPHDGYVKYKARHIWGAQPDHPLLPDLDALRTELHDMGLVGALPDGTGFGNVSLRTGEDTFLITGTGTGKKRCLGPAGYCTVTSFAIMSNEVSSQGPVRASSEALTHGAIYAAKKTARCVVHVHSRILFDSLQNAGHYATPAEAAYGTPALALAVANLARTTQCALFVLGDMMRALSSMELASLKLAS